MKGIPTELLYVLGVVAIVLFQYLGKYFRRQPHAATVEGVLKNVEPGQELIPGGSTPAVAHGPGIRVGATPSLAATEKQQSDYRSLLRTRRKARNAIVAATILGPCRAFEPSS